MLSVDRYVISGFPIVATNLHVNSSFSVNPIWLLSSYVIKLLIVTLHSFLVGSMALHDGL